MNPTHPDHVHLFSHVAGTTSGAIRRVLATHLEHCAACRTEVMGLEDVGGVLLDDLMPVNLAVGSFSRTLERIDVLTAPAPQTEVRASRPDLPAGLTWPKSLDGCTIAPWQTVGPGMRWSRIGVPEDPQGNSFLLRIAAGTELAAHTHTGLELTQVLYGAFTDEIGRWRAGDLEVADETTHHCPNVTAESECICLVAIDGRARFDGLIARALGAWMRL